MIERYNFDNDLKKHPLKKPKAETQILYIVLERGGQTTFYEIYRCATSCRRSIRHTIKELLKSGVISGRPYLNDLRKKIYSFPGYSSNGFNLEELRQKYMPKDTHDLHYLRMKISEAEDNIIPIQSGNIKKPHDQKKKMKFRMHKSSKFEPINISVGDVTLNTTPSTSCSLYTSSQHSVKS